jgi:uncharacterized repeat protein (TIGR01451 family)
VLFACALLGIVWRAAADGAQTNLWEAFAQVPARRAATNDWVQPGAFKTFRLHHETLRALLAGAPKESSRRAEESATRISLPMPDGTLADFRIVESPVMAPELAAKFPGIRTYLGQGIDDPQARVRFDLTPAGFHAQILSPRGAVYIDPYLRGETNIHAVYYKRDARRAAANFQCYAAASKAPVAQATARAAALTTPANSLRTYRLACAATAEYTQYFGGTVADGLAAIVTAINRVDGVYEAELAIRMVLVSNEDLIIYTNTATEPYSDSDAYSLLGQNQANLDAVIGDTNYDIGHVFGTGAGGLSLVGVVGVTGFKAQSETGVFPPTGDPFYIDYVSHEMGHEFGAMHPFNSTEDACGGGNRNASTAYEPGSGSTIMSYAGICGTDDLQSNCDPYFHSESLEEINDYIGNGAGNACAALSELTNSTPTVSAGPAYTIPVGTPFTLTATGSDADGDALTYCWEERDLGPAETLTAPDNGISPLFRSWLPTNGPLRTFPRWSDILNNTQTPGEQLPTTSRTLNFRVTARDVGVSGGCTASSDTQVTVTSNAGPFVVTSPVTPVAWSNSATVTWSVAGTAASPVNAATVNILLSIDGGNTYPIVLATNVPNDGSQIVSLPNLSTAMARIQIQASSNIFFAVSPVDFTIQPFAPLVAVGQSVSAPVVRVGSNVTYTVSLTNLGPYVVRKATVTDVLSPGVTLVAASASLGTWTYTNGTVSWALRNITGESCAELMLTVEADTAGAITNIVSATSDPDTNVLVINASEGVPELAPIADQTVHAGAMLLLTNTASEAGLPAGDLVFSLDPGAPAGASINPVSGLLTWCTTAANANTTNQITVRLTDSTTPGLSAAQSFTVTVLSAPVMQPLVSAQSMMTVSWSAIAGQNYWVQYKTALTDSAWTNLAEVSATSSSASYQEPIAPCGQRFYRVVAAGN